VIWHAPKKPMLVFLGEGKGVFKDYLDFDVRSTCIHDVG